MSWLQVEVEGGPLTVRGSTGQPVANPLLGALAGQRRVLDELVRSLQLPMPDELEGRRRSPRAVAAAQKRWRDKRAGGLEGG